MAGGTHTRGGPHLPDPPRAYAGGEDTGGRLVEVEGADAPHPVRDQRQDVAGDRGDTAGTVAPLAAGTPAPHPWRPPHDLHLSSFQRDDHLVVGDEGGLGAVQCHLHPLLHAWGERAAESPRPGPKTGVGGPEGKGKGEGKEEKTKVRRKKGRKKERRKTTRKTTRKKRKQKTRKKRNQKTRKNTR